jgi:hypothetical protein
MFTQVGLYLNSDETREQEGSCLSCLTVPIYKQSFEWWMTQEKRFYFVVIMMQIQEKQKGYNMLEFAHNQKRIDFPEQRIYKKRWIQLYCSLVSVTNSPGFHCCGKLFEI